MNRILFLLDRWIQKCYDELISFEFLIESNSLIDKRPSERKNSFSTYNRQSREILVQLNNQYKVRRFFDLEFVYLVHIDRAKWFVRSSNWFLHFQASVNRTCSLLVRINEIEIEPNETKTNFFDLFDKWQNEENRRRKPSRVHSRRRIQSFDEIHCRSEKLSNTCQQLISSRRNLFFHLDSDRTNWKRNEFLRDFRLLPFD